MKAKRPLTEEEIYQSKLDVESELARVTRQHTILENERGAYTSGAKLVKQQRVINILVKEHHNVLKDLCVATSSTKKTIDKDITTNLCGLLGEFDSFEGLIKEKKENLDEIDYQIDKVKKDLIIIKTKVPTEADYGARVLEGAKKLESVDNKLEMVTKRCCVISTENRHLREEIDHLLKERMDFNKVWDALIENLHKGKAFMLDLIEQSTIAYNQRDEWCTRLQVLRTRAHGDLIKHTEEMQDFQKKMDNDIKLRDFATVRGQKRIMKRLEEKLQQKRLDKTAKMLEIREKYVKTLAEIIECTGIKHVDQFTKIFMERDDENFCLFNYVIEVNQQIEDLCEHLVMTHNAIDEAKEVHSERDIHQSNKLFQLRADYKRIKHEADESEAELNRTNNLLQQLYSGIGKLFQKCKCSNAPFLQLLGDNTKIHDTSILLHLNVLEDRVSELLMNNYYVEKTTPRKAKIRSDVIDQEQLPLEVTQIDRIVPTNPCPLCVELDMVYDIIDTLQFVETRDEVIERLERRLQLPDGLDRLHNVSVCNLPKSREIIQRRYQ